MSSLKEAKSRIGKRTNKGQVSKKRFKKFEQILELHKFYQ